MNIVEVLYPVFGCECSARSALIVKVSDRHRLRVKVSQAVFFSPLHCFQEFLHGDPTGDFWVVKGLIFHTVLRHDIHIGGFRESVSHPPDEFLCPCHPIGHDQVSDHQPAKSNSSLIDHEFSDLPVHFDDCFLGQFRVV